MGPILFKSNIISIATTFNKKYIDLEHQRHFREKMDPNDPKIVFQIYSFTYDLIGIINETHFTNNFNKDLSFVFVFIDFQAKSINAAPVWTFY